MVYTELESQSETTTPYVPPPISFSAYEAAELSRFKDSFVKYGQENVLGMRKNQPRIGETTSTNLGTEHETDGGDWKKRHSYSKGYFSPDSFGSNDEVMAALKKPVSSYSLIFEHPSVQKAFTRPKRKSGAQKKQGTGKAKSEKLKPVSGKAVVKKENRFPQNVRSLTMTGILDGVPVRYILTGKEKLRGVIKGGDYQCGCDSCNFSKTFNASDFEHHAGCKTSHPNNHIRFQNGKTIHEIVQELKNTPEDVLADAIQNATGSTVNETAFRAWKESFDPARKIPLARFSLRNTRITTRLNVIRGISSQDQ